MEIITKKAQQKLNFFRGDPTGNRPHVHILQNVAFGTGPRGASCWPHIAPAVRFPRTVLRTVLRYQFKSHLSVTFKLVTPRGIEPRFPG